MAIDEKSEIVVSAEHAATAAVSESSHGGETSESPETPSRATPRFIQTWPLGTGEDPANGASATGRQPSLPPTVQQWPAWLQKQWRDTQRRRAWELAHPPTLSSRLLSPLGILVMSAVVVIALIGMGVGAALGAGAAATNSPTTATSSSGSTTSMAGMASSSASSSNPTNIPNATQPYGNQPAKFVLEAGGVKHFTFTAEQVMWEPVKGHRVLAWTLDGTVPGPMIHVTAGDHVRITINNHLPEATAIHWHGLEVPSNQDGVPGVSMSPIQSGQSYTYDFTLQDQDAGTHWYHTHYDDMVQMRGGLYGAIIVDPRPGSPEASVAIHADVEYTEFISQMPDGYYVLNGKSFPDTQPIAVKHGQTVHLRLIGADAQMAHPMHLHGHTFSIVAEDGHALPQPIQKDTVEVAPGETYDLVFNAWAAPGSVYPFHCHILSHVMNPGQSGTEMGGLLALIEYAK